MSIYLTLFLIVCTTVCINFCDRIYLVLMSTLSVFRRQKCLICNSVCEKRFTIVLQLQTLQMLIRGWLADNPCANMFPRKAVGKLCGLSITDAWQCMPMWKKAQAIKAPPHQQRSRGQIVQTTNVHLESSKTWFENTSGLQFAKRDFRNEFLESWC